MGSVVVLREEVAPKRQTPLRRPNRELRTREHLTEREVEKLIEAAKGNRWGHRDSTMILIAFRHALRRPSRGRWRYSGRTLLGSSPGPKTAPWALAED
jgi:hypothetical protein